MRSLGCGSRRIGLICRWFGGRLCRRGFEDFIVERYLAGFAGGEDVVAEDEEDGY